MIIVLAINACAMSIMVIFMAAEIRRMNARWQEVKMAFKVFLIADLDCHWKDSAERLLKVLERAD